MKKQIGFVITAILSASVSAQVIQTLPNGAGGYNTYGRNGSLTQTLPNGAGGYNTYSPNGQLTQTLPNGAREWATVGASGL